MAPAKLAGACGRVVSPRSEADEFSRQWPPASGCGCKQIVAYAAKMSNPQVGGSTGTSDAAPSLENVRRIFTGN